MGQAANFLLAKYGRELFKSEKMIGQLRVKLDEDFIVKRIREKYFDEFKKMDSRGYFMAGFVMSVLKDINAELDQVEDEIKNSFK